LANTDQPDRCDLKLALGIMNTSAERTLASHTVRNAAPISDWLHDLVTADPALNGLVVRREVLGISAGALHGHLAAIWRESLAPQLTSGEAAVSFTRLATSDAPSDPTLRARLIRDGAAVWVRQLLEVTLVPLVHLLVRHGIGVEAHAQNLLLIHERGWPARLAIHDLHDGIRFARHHLAAPEAAPPLVATPEAHLAANRNSYVEAVTAEEVRDFVLDALLVVNLGELAMALDDQGFLPEYRFWQLARGVLAAHRRRHPDLARGYDAFGVFAPAFHVEQLTARRLFPESERRFHEVANPLAGTGRRKGRGC
jgi:siderophore synthetase component